MKGVSGANSWLASAGASRNVRKTVSLEFIPVTGRYLRCYPQFELPFNIHQSDSRRLLDAAARILRQRITPESRFYALVEGIPESPLAPFSEIALPYTERLARLADPGQPQVGDMPPQPPTLRARCGAILVTIVRRMLF